MFSFQALKLLLEGKKIRKTDWDLDYYIYYEEDDNFLIKDCNNKRKEFSFDQYFDIWEEYIPKGLSWEELIVGLKVSHNSSYYNIAFLNKDLVLLLADDRKSYPDVILYKAFFEDYRVYHAKKQ